MAPTATFLDLVKGRLSESQERIKELRRQITEAETTEAAYQAVYSQELRRAQYEGDRIVVPSPPMVVTVLAPSTNGHHAVTARTFNEIQTAILLVVDQGKEPIRYPALRDNVYALLPGLGYPAFRGNLISLVTAKVIENIGHEKGNGLYRRVSK